MGTAAAQLRSGSSAASVGPALGEQLASLRWNWKGQPQEGSVPWASKEPHGPKNSLISGP